MTQVYYCTLPADKEGFDELLFHVSNERQTRIKRFVKMDDAYRSLIGDLLVRYAVIERYGSLERELKVETNDFGKPFLSEYPSFYYNVSHSGQYVVCAVHDQAVGVDIEYMGPYDIRLAKEFFTEEEYQDLSNARDDGLETFYELWTLKESYVKAIGVGLSKPLKDFSMSKHQDGSIQITDTHTGRQISDYICRSHQVDKDYRLSVCAQHSNEAPLRSVLTCVTFPELCERLNHQSYESKNQRK